MHLGASGVQKLGPGKEQQPRHRDPDRAVFERPAKAVERSRSHHRVGIEEDEHVAGRLARTAVGAGRKPEVLARRDDADAFPCARVGDLLAALPVVDDDDLVGLAGERVEQPPERRARAIGDRDDRNAHASSISRMKILVTGGGGFLGSHLVERLRSEGNDPFVARA